MGEGRKKESDILLVLTAEERKAAQDFVERRVHTLDVRELPQIQDLVTAVRQQIQRIQSSKDRYQGASDRYSGLMAKLCDSALSGLAGLVETCNRATGTKERELKEMRRAHATGQAKGESAAQGETAGAAEEELEAFVLPLSEEEEQHALDYIQERVKALNLPDLTGFRGGCQQLIR